MGWGSTNLVGRDIPKSSGATAPGNDHFHAGGSLGLLFSGEVALADRAPIRKLKASKFLASTPPTQVRVCVP